HHPAAYGVIDERPDDRDRLGRLLGGLARCSTHRHDDVHLQTDQVGREDGVAIGLALGPSGLDGDVLTFHIAQVAQSVAEGFETALPSLVRMGTRREITYPGHLLPGLGRSRAEWRKREADSENDREPDQPHGHLGGDGWRGVYPNA